MWPLSYLCKQEPQPYCHGLVSHRGRARRCDMQLFACSCDWCFKIFPIVGHITQYSKPVWSELKGPGRSLQAVKLKYLTCERQHWRCSWSFQVAGYTERLRIDIHCYWNGKRGHYNTWFETFLPSLESPTTHLLFFSWHLRTITTNTKVSVCFLHLWLCGLVSQ